jgi:hypothetical protein
MRGECCGAAIPLQPPGVLGKPRALKEMAHSSESPEMRRPVGLGGPVPLGFLAGALPSEACECAAADPAIEKRLAEQRWDEAAALAAKVVAAQDTRETHLCHARTLLARAARSTVSVHLDALGLSPARRRP